MITKISIVILYTISIQHCHAGECQDIVYCHRGLTTNQQTLTIKKLKPIFYQFSFLYKSLIFDLINKIVSSSLRLLKGVNVERSGMLLLTCTPRSSLNAPVCIYFLGYGLFSMSLEDPIGRHLKETFQDSANLLVNQG